MIWHTDWLDPTLTVLLGELAQVEREAARLLVRAHRLRMQINAYPTGAPKAAPFRMLSAGPKEPESRCGRFPR